MITVVILAALALFTFEVVLGLHLAQEIYRRIRHNAAPYVSVSRKALPGVADALVLTPKAIVYDLGCGDGRILKILSEREPRARYIGIEWNTFPYLHAKWNTRDYANIEIRNANFFKENLRGATHIVTYLYPHVLDALLPKLEAELSPQTVLVSIDFAFSKKVPEREIILGHNRRLGKRLFVYRF